MLDKRILFCNLAVSRNDWITWGEAMLAIYLTALLASTGAVPIREPQPVKKPVAAISLPSRPAAPSADKHPHDPIPASNPGTWVGRSDYPSTALRSEAEGVVGFRLDVDADGVPTACSVTRSSGNTALDETACSLVQSRGRFTPATDAKGKAIAGSWSSSVRWEIPDGPRPWPKPSDFDATFVIEADGSVSECRVDRRGDIPAGADPCERLRAGKFQRPLDPLGRPTRLRVHSKYVTTVERLPI